jgi:hypothetical protein
MQQLATEGIPLTLALSLHAYLMTSPQRVGELPINYPVNVDGRDRRGRGSMPERLAPGLHRVHPDPGPSTIKAFRAEQLAKVLRRRGNLGLGARQLDPDESDARLGLDRLTTQR